MSVNTTEYLNGMVAGFQQAMDEVRTLIEGVDNETLNTPEAPGKWSMLQCIEHISRATQVYNDNISAKLNNGQLQPAAAAYKGHWKGRMFAKMNAPKPGGEIPMKLKTFKSMEPPEQLNSKEVVSRFYTIHETLVSIIDQSRSINIDKAKVATALGPMVKLRMGEAYRFILAHTQRHLVQLARIKATVST